MLVYEQKPPKSITQRFKDRPDCLTHLDRKRRMQEAQKHLLESLELVQAITFASQMVRNDPEQRSQLERTAEMLTMNIQAQSEIIENEKETLDALPELTPQELAELSTRRPSSFSTPSPIFQGRSPQNTGFSAPQRDYPARQTTDSELGKRSPMLTRAGKRQFDEISRLPSHMLTPPRKNAYQGPSGLPRNPNRFMRGSAYVEEEPEHPKRPTDSEGSKIYDSDDDPDDDDTEGNSSMDDDLKTPSSENERLNQPGHWQDPHSRKIRETALKTKALLANKFNVATSKPKPSRSRIKSKQTQGLKRTGAPAKVIQRTDQSRIYSASRPKSHNSKYVARVRGCYNSYPESVKLKVIEFAHQNSAIEAAQKYEIPVKNIKRWMKNGPERKKGGRKTQDPIMESQLAEWIRQYIKKNNEMPGSRMIKDKALALSRFEDFKASKGWLEKFMHRNSFSEPKKHRPESNSTFLDVDNLTPILKPKPRSPSDSNQSPYSPGA